MARFDVHRLVDGGSLVLDCQADLLSSLKTRVVAPLVSLGEAPPPMGRLNPVFEVDGESCVMLTQYLATADIRELGIRIMTLAGAETEIINALDMLLTGY
jgi:toxin CcdB